MIVILKLSPVSTLLGVFAGTPLTEEDSDALEKLLLDNKIKGFALTGERTYQTVVHHLYELGHEELASNLRSNLDKGIVVIVKAVGIK